MVVVGGGHNGLTSAAYLARAGLSVLVVERLPEVGGAATATQAFAGREASIARYAQRVSAMPDQILSDLELDLRLAAPRSASYSPLVRDGRHTGLLVEHPEGAATRASFRVLTGGTTEYEAWRELADDVAALTRTVAPTLLQPLPTERDLRGLVDPDIWHDLVAAPLGETIERRFTDDTVRGLVAMRALEGCFVSPRDPSLVQNRTYLFRVLGETLGQQRLPIGGMRAVTEALHCAARAAGAEILTSSGVSSIRAAEDGAEVSWQDTTGAHTVGCRWVLANVAPWVLQILLGSPDDPATKPAGAMMTITMLLQHLPALKSGIDPRLAFSGNVRIGQGYEQLCTAYDEAAAGRLPSLLPGDVSCHSLTDSTILGALAPQGFNSMQYVGHFAHESLFTADPEATKAEAVRRALAALDQHLVEPLESCLALDGDGNPCLEARIPQEIERELAMPGGHIFHGDLDWPWVSHRARLDTPAQQWGVNTDVASVLLCGAGARRGGGVTGIAGHNAAQAVLASR